MKAKFKNIAHILVSFIGEEINKAGLKRCVLGLSGGVDSALVAFLAGLALGPQNVFAYSMPYKTSNPQSLAHARLVAEKTGINFEIIEITKMVDDYFEMFPDAGNLRRGNKMARERMSILFDKSTEISALVLGTSNKTELLLGYGTLYGDMASAINPIGDLYKTDVWGLAEFIGVPQEIVKKSPSADLWEGQTDEEELGFSYAEIDALLKALIEERKNPEELEKTGFKRVFIETVLKRIVNSQFKRKLPVIAKVSKRTIDREFRYPRDWQK